MREIVESAKQLISARGRLHRKIERDVKQLVLVLVFGADFSNQTDPRGHRLV